MGMKPYIEIADDAKKKSILNLYKVEIVEVINCIFYKLKTGIQWRFLPLKELFSDVVLSYKTVFYHFRKWCKNGDWVPMWTNLLKKHRKLLDLSSVDLDGSHTRAIKGGEEVGYQGRKNQRQLTPCILQIEKDSRCLCQDPFLESTTIYTRLIQL